MTLLGDAAVAMWWNVAASDRTEFHDWHSKEHLPERLSIPGFLRGSRWESTDGGGDFFVVYELEAYEMLTSEAYLARLNSPTPWSTRMMPRHRNMVRSQCRVMASSGAGVATYMTTLRLSPREGRDAELASFVRMELEGLVKRVGVTGAHLLRTETPKAALTREQQIRGRDAVADWIVMISGYDADLLQDVHGGTLAPDALRKNGADDLLLSAPYRLVHVMTPQDL
jgi:hypothetical protein